MCFIKRKINFNINQIISKIFEKNVLILKKINTLKSKKFKYFLLITKFVANLLIICFVKKIDRTH